MKGKNTIIIEWDSGIYLPVMGHVAVRSNNRAMKVLPLSLSAS